MSKFYSYIIVAAISFFVGVYISETSLQISLAKGTPINGFFVNYNKGE